MCSINTQASTVSWDMGSWVSHFSTDGAHINRLCVREAIALMQSGLPKRSGQIKIPGTMRIPSPLMTIQDEAGTAYFMVTSITYSSDQRLASVDRLQVNALDLTNVSDNGDEGQGTDGRWERLEADLEVMAVEPQMMMDQEVEDLEPAPMEVAPRDQS